MNAQREFYGKITGLAVMCGFGLTPEVIGLYDKHLSALGYEALCRALDEIIVSRRSRDPFPSIAEIRERIEPKIDPESEAIEAANRIYQAVCRISPYESEYAKAHIGELGWQVVLREGGWMSLVESITDYEQVGTRKAQWRQLAKALYLRAKTGQFDAPKLPGVEQGKMPFNPKTLLPEMPR